MVSAIAVALGGAAGALLRYFIGLRLNVGEFPFGTLIVNLVGSFLIGFVVLVALKQRWEEPWLLFAVTGVLGGFTTFSAFSAENLQLLQSGKLSLAAAYCIASPIAGIALAWCGFSLAQKLSG